MPIVFPEKIQNASLQKKGLVLPYEEAKEALQWCFENGVEIFGWEGCFVYRNTTTPPDLPEHQTLPDGTKIMGFGPSKEIIGTTSFGPETGQEQIYQTCIKTIEESEKEYATKTEMKDIALYYWLTVAE